MVFLPLLSIERGAFLRLPCDAVTPVSAPLGGSHGLHDTRLSGCFLFFQHLDLLAAFVHDRQVNGAAGQIHFGVRIAGRELCVQGVNGGIHAVNGRGRFALNVLPEAFLRLFQGFQLCFVPLDDEHFEVNAQNQNRQIPAVKAGHKQVMAALRVVSSRELTVLEFAQVERVRGLDL